MRLPPIQEAIHWLEVGPGARALRLLVGVLTLLVLAVWFDSSQMRNFSAPDAMEAAQLARNLSRGEGFTTHVVRPLTIQWVDETQGVDARLNHRAHPDLYSPPLYPLLLAGWMKLLPFDFEVQTPFWRYQPELLIALLNQVFFLVTVWLAYRLGRRLMNGEAGVLLAILLLASELLWRFSTSGHSTMLLMLLGVGLLWVVATMEEGARTRGRRLKSFLLWGGLAGLLVGLMGLTRYAMVALLLPLTVYGVLFLGRRAGATVLMAWLVCAVVVTPWLIRNYQASGRWFGVGSVALYQETIRFPNARLERTFEPDLSVVGPWDVIRKGAEGLRSVLGNDLLRLGGGWFGAFFLVGLVGQYGKPALNRMRVFLVFSVATLAVAQAVSRTHVSTLAPGINSENLLVLLTPGVFLVGIGFYQWMLGRFELPYPEFRHVISTVLVLGTGAPLLMGLLPPRVVPITYPPYFPPYLQEVSGLLKPSEMLVTDMPWGTAWYGDRQSAWTPMDDRASFFRLHDEHKRVSALLLTPLTTDAAFRKELMQGRDFAWSRFALEVMLRTNVVAGFPLRQAWSYGAPSHLFLSDYARWRLSEPPPPLPPEATLPSGVEEGLRLDAEGQPIEPPAPSPVP